jgi:methylmalonyl-CoA/ethylmalonyl-CoA epimerase
MTPLSAPPTGIGQIAINVHDVERATRFYRDALGMQHLFSVESMSFFQCGDVRIMLGLPDRPEFDHPSSIIYFTVADARVAYDELKEVVVFRDEPLVVHRTEEYELWMAFFRDPEGNTLALMSEIPRKP